MKNRFRFSATIIVIALLTFSATFHGVEMPDSMQAGESSLVLNGAGLRTKMFKLYVGGLYLTEKSSDANDVIDSEKPMAIRLEIISGLITAEKMEEATREGFVKSTKGNTAPIADEIESFLAVFQETISIGDIFEFVHIPGSGVSIRKNGIEKDMIEGMEFKKALFGIWLCDKPAQKKLKNGMLGL